MLRMDKRYGVIDNDTGAVKQEPAQFVHTPFLFVQNLMNLIESLLPRFSFRAETFFAGEFCGANNFGSEQNVGHLHLVRRGPVTMQHDDGSSVQATEPTLIFYPRPFNHRLIVPAGSNAELLCAKVMFKEAASNPIALALPSYVAIPLKDVPGMDITFSLAHAEKSRGGSGERFILDRLCEILVFQIIRHEIDNARMYSGVLAGFSDPGIAKALNAFHEDPAADWSLDDLARQALMSRSKFALRFRELVGTTPASYVADWRLALAERLLMQNQPAKVVASAVGYGSQSSFTRAFIDRNGMPPKEWLRQRSGTD